MDRDKVSCRYEFLKYDVIDLLKAQYSPKLIRNKFSLTDAQITKALFYIKANRTHVEAEYQEVLQRLGL
jgi:hypothetical protein